MLFIAKSSLPCTKCALLSQNENLNQILPSHAGRLFHVDSIKRSPLFLPENGDEKNSMP